MFHDVNAAVGVSGRKAEEGCFMMLTPLLVFQAGRRRKGVS